MDNLNGNICNNCGKSGHFFYQCKLPIISYGIVAFNVENEKISFLMIRRKNTFGYIDFIRGKYSPLNEEHVQNIVDEMSVTEKKSILNESFPELWKKMWGETINVQHKNEEILSGKKFAMITNGMVIDNKVISLENIVNSSTSNWEETEWEFPKGRRNFDENDLTCALREFEEETGVKKTDIQLIENILPFEETFIGTNFKSYKHKYFLAYMKNTGNVFNYQETEVSKIEWKTYDECLQCIRPYNLEKKYLIEKIYKVIREYTLY